MPQPDAAQIQAAVQLHFSGQLDQAERAYRGILAHYPDEPASTHMLGMLLHQRGNNQAAEPLLLRSLELAKRNPDFQHNYALFCRATGRLDMAERHLRRALMVSNSYAPAHNTLGLVLEDQGKLAEAANSFAAAIAAKPDFVDAHLHLGLLHNRLGKFKESVESLRRVLQFRPQMAAAHIALCSALGKLGRLDESIRHGQMAVQLAPDDSDSHAVLACAMVMRGLGDQAMAHFSHALRLQPRNADAMTDLAWLLDRNGRYEEAAQFCRQAIQFKPQNAAALNLLSQSLRHLWQVDQAVEAATQAITLAPQLVGAWVNLGVGYLEQGNWEQAIASFRRAIQIPSENSADFRSSLLMALHYDPHIDRQVLFDEHKACQSVAAARGLTPARSHPNNRDPDRPLRIGYVSPYFRRHAVADFVEPILRHHDRSCYVITCYSDVRVKDDLTNDLRGRVQNWYDTADLSDAELTQHIRNNREDILVDLTGHIAGSRLLAFAPKPAPVQITYLGYQNTTGLEAMDYRLTDAVADPSGISEPFHVEKLLRLPCFFCYQPPDDAPAVGPPPCESAGHITFGSLNHVAKLNPELLAAWARILAAVPDSRLMILITSTGVTDRRLTDLFQTLGIPSERLRFVTRRPHAHYLALYNQIDIALDPFPFNGHTTTCDALWMGVPVINLAGQTYASRMTTSVLTHLGMPQLIASDPEQYVQIASSLAQNRATLAQLRASLRRQMSGSIITDGRKFTAELEKAYRQAWTAWCQGHAVIS